MKFLKPCWHLLCPSLVKMLASPVGVTGRKWVSDGSEEMEVECAGGIGEWAAC